MTDLQRRQLRMKQDFLLMIAVDMCGHPESRLITEGGPSLASLRGCIHPEWSNYIDTAIRLLAKDNNVAVPDFGRLSRDTDGY